MIALGAALAVLAAPVLATATVIETGPEFIASGDFNGDGQEDVAIVDRNTGRVRLGYRVSNEFFNWADWRAGGVKNVTGVSVGKLVDGKRDALAIVSADTSQMAVLDAPNPSVVTDPVAIPSELIGPNTAVAVDIGGAGNTPLHDLYIGSIYNNEEPENRATLFRSTGEAFTQITESGVPGAPSRGRRITLKNGGAEYAATLTCRGVRFVRVISRIDCCAKIGSIPDPCCFMAATWPGVARPMRSPKPKLGARPSGTGLFVIEVSSKSEWCSAAFYHKRLVQ
jgi:hypothetical protein